MDIKAISDGLSRKYDTRNPFDLASSLGIIVSHEPLGDIQGYYNTCFRQRFIHINQELEGYEAAFTCAHELGHAVLHAGLNTPFLRKHTMFSVGKIETQANRFALDFLFDDLELQYLSEYSIFDAASYMGVDIRLAEYRMSTIQHEGKPTCKVP